MSLRTCKLVFTFFLSLAVGLSGLLPNVQALAQKSSSHAVAKVVPVDQATIQMWVRYGDECAEGVFPLNPQNGCNGINYGKSAEWYAKAAEQGNAEAQVNLGFAYEQGQGVKQDYGKAVGWYAKAAGQERVEAQFNLGRLYQQGQGVKQDDERAVYWFTKAAQQGDITSQYNLGNLYARGQGVKQDYTVAYYWFVQAANGKGAKGDIGDAAAHADDNAGIVAPNVDAQRLAVLMRVRYWHPIEGQMAEQAENLKEFKAAIQGIYAGQSQATVKALLLSRGFPSWSCTGQALGGEWLSICSTAKPWIHINQYLQSELFKIILAFSVYQRVRQVDPDTQIAHFFNLPTDRLIYAVVPECSAATGTALKKCDSAVH